MRCHLSVSKKSLLFVIFVFLGFETAAEAGLKVYFIRHAQGGHNVVKEWADRPKSEWPAYVGNEDMFSPKGEEQVKAVGEKLRPYTFDFIATSPLWRARHTLLPFLTEKKLQAEIWPELEEIDFKESPPPWPAPGIGLFTGGKPIIIPDEEKNFFYLSATALFRIKVDGSSSAQSRADVEALMEKMAQTIRAKFGGTEKSILLAGHGSNWCLLLKKLTGKSQPAWPENTGLWMVEEQKDRSFELRRVNDKPYP